MSSATTTGSKRPASRPAAARAGKALSVLGVVSGLVHGPAGMKEGRPPPDWNATRLIESLEAGLPIGELEVLQGCLDLPMDKLGTLLGISRATLHRRKTQGRLVPAESDRLIRFARLLGRAVQVLESEDAARLWLNSPQVGLGGAVPLEYAATEVGAREVEDLLGRIEFGVYS